MQGRPMILISQMRCSEGQQSSIVWVEKHTFYKHKVCGLWLSESWKKSQQDKTKITKIVVLIMQLTDIQRRAKLQSLVSWGVNIIVFLKHKNIYWLQLDTYHKTNCNCVFLNKILVFAHVISVLFVCTFPTYFFLFLLRLLESYLNLSSDIDAIRSRIEWHVFILLFRANC